MNDRIIVLSTDGNLLPIYEIMRIAYPTEARLEPPDKRLNGYSFIRERINDMLDRMIKSCRYRGRIISNVHGHVNWFCSTVILPPYPYHHLTVDQQGNVDADCKLKDDRDFRTIVKDLATTILFQLEQFGLYNENGFLEYEFLAIDNQYFNEIAIKRIPQLIGNGSSYATPI
jgi:hypothetical protein